MEEMNMAILWPLIALDLILLLIVLIDLGKRDVTRVRGEMKWVWVLVAIVIQPLGSIAYLIAGRKD